VRVDEVEPVVSMSTASIDCVTVDQPKYPTITAAMTPNAIQPRRRGGAP
jgi:hypothetical protein